jgi:hypothetical protein
MSSEKINQNLDKEHPLNDALEQVGVERRKELEKLREDTERSPEKNVDDARHEALETAKSLEVEKVPKQEREISPAERRANGPIRKTEREASFKTTMKEVQTQMSAPSRTFSKIIHNKAVEKVSETAGSTIARPNAILSGAIFAFALTLAVYLIAKNLGYRLSGFESIGAFILGWALGLVYDFLKVMITGRK